ncbi:hypothetical protein S40293_01348 [Stachybotrys chartarum IBT 40293]|nr:hypothetical protein S40293_01348 [Stachybotrys chartarum IBT 40293]
MNFSYSGPQPYAQQFVPIPPPLTPSHSHSTASDDYNRTSPENFDGLPQADGFSGFDFPSADFNPHQQDGPRFPGPPTPPSNYAPNPYQHQQHNLLGHANGLDVSLKPIHTDFPPHDSSHEDLLAHGRNGSEEDDNLSPAQSRRKAQNRAAQRAFRERKEKHVKDLENKLASLEAAQQHASQENSRLIQALAKAKTENEILRATSTTVGGNTNQQSPEPTTTGPMTYNPTDFYSNVLQNHAQKQPSHRIVTTDDGQRLLAVGAAWDFIISHDLFKRGLVDVGDVSDRLRPCARCDGQGPVFAEQDIIHAMQQSAANGNDDLL